MTMQLQISPIFLEPIEETVYEDQDTSTTHSRSVNTNSS